MNNYYVVSFDGSSKIIWGDSFEEACHRFKLDPDEWEAITEWAD